MSSEFSVHSDLYRIADYDDVNQYLIAPEEVFDVVGRVVNINKFTTIKENNGERKIIKFQLQSPSGKYINCSLVGEHAIKLLRVARTSHHNGIPLVALIHNCKLRECAGPMVRNISRPSRLYLNEKIEPIYMFNSLFANNPDLPMLMDVPAISDYYHEDTISFKPEFIYHRAIKIADMKYWPKETEFLIRGRVSRVSDNHGWFMRSCIKCDKEVDEIELLDKEGTIWIRTAMRVTDVSGRCDIILFDKLLSKLAGKSEGWLNAMAESYDVAVDVPSELFDLNNRNTVFLAKKSESYINNNYKTHIVVLDATYDPDVLEVINKKHFEDVASINRLDEVVVYQPPTPYQKKNFVRRCFTKSSSLKRKSIAANNVIAEDTPSQQTSDEDASLKNPNTQPF
ncbi:uncharacterized protein [Rutidosis leptorrhynchoides]|uniref:uncharacterized protein n=1 Tax=Rutidosis leptorrhynchoides TaxID=125765 RepID=UPI003A9A2260